VHNPFRGIILPETAIDIYLRNYNYSYTFLDANNSISLFIVPLSSQIIKKTRTIKDSRKNAYFNSNHATASQFVDCMWQHIDAGGFNDFS